MPSRFFILLGLLAVIICTAAGARAQELTALSGTTGSGAALKSHYSWQIDYRQQLDRNLAWSIAWINEGHELEHHRDGIAGELWAVLPFRSDRFSLSFGTGAYHYFDTELLPDGTSVNTRGWTPIYSVAATYYTRTPWFLRLTANRINRANDLETNALVAGVGYRFGPTYAAPNPALPPAADTLVTDHELTLFAGQSIVNTAESENALAVALEYRAGLTAQVEWTASWLHEGDPEIIRRNGFATQLWLVDSFLDDRFTVGLGAGPYLLFDRKRSPTPGRDDPRNVAGLVSPTATWRLDSRWQARLTWNRVVSNYNRDADLFLLGLGYRWGDGW